MTDERLPVAVWSGSFNLFGVEVKCHTLSDGRRIIEADSMVALLEVLDGGQSNTDAEYHDITAFTKWQRGQ